MESSTLINEEIKWAARKRLELIEKELFWTGRVNRQTLMEKTGISKAQASSDLAQYKRLADNNLTYNLTEKTYQVTPSFSPLFINTSPQAFLSQMALLEEDAEQLRLPARDIQPMFLRIVAMAVQSATCVEITYQSMSTPEPRDRIIAPHTFVSDGWRWHVRAYDFLSGSFRDFLLARILQAKECELSEGLEVVSYLKDHDVEWHTNITLRIVPHPDLSLQQKSVVESDFGMVDGEVLFPVRQACLFYALRQMRLLDESEIPAAQQIVLANKNEILSMLKKPYRGGDFE